MLLIAQYQFYHTFVKKQHFFKTHKPRSTGLKFYISLNPTLYRHNVPSLDEERGEVNTSTDKNTVYVGMLLGMGVGEVGDYQEK